MTLDLAPDQVPEGWSGIADAYQRQFENMTAQLSNMAHSMLNIQQNEMVLDVATGPGVFALSAARLGAEVVAVDFAPGMIERLDQRLLQQGVVNVSTAVMDGQSLEFDDDSFDVSASIVGVIFFPDINKGLKELVRVLRPGGRCGVVCWGNPASFQMFRYFQDAIASAVPDFEMPDATPVWARMHGVELLAEHMQLAGFDRVDASSFTAEHQIPSIRDYWQEFILTAPPLQSLFKTLGKRNTERTGDVFVNNVMQDCGGESVCLTAEACVGIGYK